MPGQRLVRLRPAAAAGGGQPAVKPLQFWRVANFAEDGQSFRHWSSLWLRRLGLDRGRVAAGEREPSGRDDVDGTRGMSIPKNYAFLLIGCLLFPLAIVSAVVARGRLKASAGWEASHWVFQLYTAVGLLVSSGVLSGVVILFFLLLSSTDPVQAVKTTMLTTAVSNLFYVVFGWVAVRAVRGLYLAGAKTPISNPRTLSPWPRSPT